MEIYKSLDEALGDIEFSCYSRYAKFLFDYGGKDELEKDGHITQKREIILGGLASLLNFRSKSPASIHGSLSILVELLKNAHRYVKEGEICSFEVYVGKKGILYGTKQESEFMATEQIALLKSGKSIPSTNSKCGGSGTRIILEEGNGLLILEKEKSIYVSKYYS